jgi:uncharacterized membrane protein HdeD (DUF308 family)
MTYADGTDPGSRRQKLSTAIFWVLLFRGCLVIALGVGLIINPVKTEALLLNFMGFFWLISGITLVLRPNTALGKSESLAMGLIGILTGLIVVGRNVVGSLLTNLLLLEVLGAVILLTGVANMLGETKIGRRALGRQTAYHFLLGVFEFVMGATLLVSAIEPGHVVYWLATVWALIGGALILSQALYLRSQRRFP